MKFKKTLIELYDNPEGWTEEDVADIQELNNSFSEFKKAVVPYAVNKNK